ncbi:Uncharacterised protein [Vibrio cholerae]|nr:Uncharacterised protein [Vibrio cholerae]
MDDAYLRSRYRCHPVLSRLREHAPHHQGLAIRQQDLPSYVLSYLPAGQGYRKCCLLEHRRSLGSALRGGR